MLVKEVGFPSLHSKWFSTKHYQNFEKARLYISKFFMSQHVNLPPIFTKLSQISIMHLSRQNN